MQKFCCRIMGWGYFYIFRTVFTLADLQNILICRKYPLICQSFSIIYCHPLTHRTNWCQTPMKVIINIGFHYFKMWGTAKQRIFESVVCSKPVHLIADHNIFKMGHFPTVHLKMPNYYSFPHPKSLYIRSSKYSNSLNSSKSEGVSPEQRFPWVAHFWGFLHLVAHRRKYSQHNNHPL
jgi:hypothetical protein